jgi:hypothetical protein
MNLSIKLDTFKVVNGYHAVLSWCWAFFLIGLITTSIEMVISNLIFAAIGLVMTYQYHKVAIEHTILLSVVSMVLKIAAAVGLILLAKHTAAVSVVGMAFLVPTFAFFYHVIEAGYVQHLVQQSVQKVLTEK